MINDYIVLDIETTGLSPQGDKITEIGAVKVINQEVVSEYKQLINPEMNISYKITEITGISNELVADQPTIEVVMPEFIAFISDYPIMGHNVMFDYSFLKTNAVNLGYTFEKNGLDTLGIAKLFIKGIRSRSLTNLCGYYEIDRENAHRAYDDAYATYELYQILKRNYCNEETLKAFQPKPLHYKIKRDEGITARQKSFLLALSKGHHVPLNKSIDDFTKSEASRMIDQIISTYGRLY